MTRTDTSPARPSVSRSARVERYETVVIGGGQAGLAVGQQLAERDADFIILDAASRVGDTWRRRWSSLKLFTPARYSALPGMPFPATPAHLPTKDDVADYLERYADRFDLPVRSATSAKRLAHDGERFLIETSGGLLEADNVVIATGPFHTPRIPSFATQLSPQIHQRHSSAYRDPLDLPLGGDALVVGAGNSGAQIAIELARFRPVHLAGRNTGHIPRRFFGRDVFDWIWPITRRFSMETSIGRRMAARGEGGDALIGIPESHLSSAGVRRVGRIVGERDGRPLIDDGTVLDPRVIVWSTGFRPNFDWIDLPVFDERGLPRHRRGVVAEVPGLFFVGLRFQHRVSSSLIGGVGADASFVAEQVTRRTHSAVA